MLTDLKKRRSDTGDSRDRSALELLSFLTVAVVAVFSLIVAASDRNMILIVLGMSLGLLSVLIWRRDPPGQPTGQVATFFGLALSVFVTLNSSPIYPLSILLIIVLRAAELKFGRTRDTG